MAIVYRTVETRLEREVSIKLDILISLSEAINDGVSDYEAGLYHQVIFVNPK